MAKSGNKGGRPRKLIDWDDVDKLCALQCTGNEIAAFVGVCYDTLDTRCKEKISEIADDGTEYRYGGFSDYYAEKAQLGKISLRRAQMRTALGGSPPMQIWLGKQHLGQVDRQEFSGPNGGPIPITRIAIVAPKVDDDGKAVEKD